MTAVHITACPQCGRTPAIRRIERFHAACHSTEELHAVCVNCGYCYRHGTRAVATNHHTIG